MSSDWSHVPQDVLDAWANCSVPDCEYKVCKWLGGDVCHRHYPASDEEKEAAYQATHPDGYWDGSVWGAR